MEWYAPNNFGSPVRRPTRDGDLADAAFPDIYHILLVLDCYLHFPNQPNKSRSELHPNKL